MLGLCWHASSQILYTDRINTENSCPVLTLNIKVECFHADRFCQLAWCRQGRITSSTSSITPFEQFGTFKAHQEVLLLSLWPLFSGSTFTAIVITAPTSAIRAEVWERDCRCACALQSPRDFNWTQLLYISFSKWHSLLYRLRLLSRSSQEDFLRWPNDEGFCDNATSFKVGHE